MKILIGIFASLAVASASSQVYKCTVDGQVVYSDRLCPGAREINPAQLRTNTVDAYQPPISSVNEFDRESNSGRIPKSSSSCLSNQEIKNLETKAKSITIKKEEKEFLASELERARSCTTSNSKYTDADLKKLKELQDGQGRINSRDRKFDRDEADLIHASKASEEEKMRMQQEKQSKAALKQVEAERRAKSRVQHPILHGCDASGCNGPDGRYTNAGQNLISPMGKTCIPIGGGNYSCN